MKVFQASLHSLLKIPWFKQERYSSFSRGIGLRVDEGSATLEEMEVCLLNH